MVEDGRLSEYSSDTSLSRQRVEDQGGGKYVRDGRTLCARVCFTVYTNTLDTTCVVCMKNLNITYA